MSENHTSDETASRNKSYGAYGTHTTYGSPPTPPTCDYDLRGCAALLAVVHKRMTLEEAARTFGLEALS